MLAAPRRSRHLRLLLAVACSALVWSVPANAATWTAPLSLYPPDPGRTTLAPHIAVDDAGYGVAVVGTYLGPGYQLRAAERLPGGAWQLDPQPLTGDVLTQSRYDVSIDAAGNALAVWDVDDATSQTLWASTWHPGSGWTPATPVARTLTSQLPSSDMFPLSFTAAINAAGQMVVAWQSVDNVAAPGCCEYITTLWGMVGSPTGGWSQPVPVATTGPIDRAFFMTAAIGPSGDAAIQWTQGSNIEVAVGPAAGGFRANAPIAVTSIAPPELAEGGSVAVDAAGDVLSVFADHGPVDVPVPGEYPTPFFVGSSFRPAGGTFGAVQRVAPWTGNDYVGQITAGFDGQGTATIAWVVLAPPALIGTEDSLLETATRPAGAASAWSAPTQLAGPQQLGPLHLAEAPDGSAVLSLDGALLLTRAGAGVFGDPEALPCIQASIAIATDGDAAASCTGPSPDNGAKILTRYLHVTGSAPAPAPATTAAATAHAPVTTPVPVTKPVAHAAAVALGLRSVRIVRGRLVLRGRASGKATVTVTIRRHARRKAVKALHLELRGGAWSRSLHLPRTLAPGRYDVLARGTHVRSVHTSFRIRPR